MADDELKRLNVLIPEETRDWVYSMKDATQSHYVRLVVERAILVTQLVAQGIDPHTVPAAALILEAAAADPLTAAATDQYQGKRRKR